MVFQKQNKFQIKRKAGIQRQENGHIMMKVVSGISFSETVVPKTDVKSNFQLLHYCPLNHI